MALFSIMLEKHCIGGLFQNPEVLADVDGFLSEKDFYIEPHNVIFSCLRNLILSNERPDKVLLAQKIKNLGISFKENIDIFSYIEAITFAPITKDATKEACQELVKLKFLRDLESTSKEISSHINKSVGIPIEQTLSEVDAIYSKTINSFRIKDGVEDLFGQMYEQIEETGNNPITEIGIPTPFPEFNSKYGGLRNGNVYIIVARPKSGKTSFLNYLAAEISRKEKIHCLICDTEMSGREIRFRTAAAITGVPLWDLETGSWRQNQSHFEKIRNEKFKNIKNDYRVHHIAVGNTPVEKLSSIIRRWHMNYVGRGNRCLVILDYVKLTGEKLGANVSEYQVIGDKIDKLKKLAEELEFPLFTAGQMNRMGENRNKGSDSEILDDSSVVAISDRLSWFCTYIGSFRRKSQSEYTLDTPASGTHRLTEIFARYLGKDAVRQQGWIQRTMPDGEVKYISDYINFNINNFNVSSCGDARDAIARQNAMFRLTDNNADSEQTL